MVVDDLDVQGSKFRPSKTKPPLGIDADAVLADTVPGQGFKVVITLA